MFKIAINQGSGKCEDCGWYGWTSVKITHNGQEVCDEYNDDHLGGTSNYGVTQPEGILRCIVDMLNKAGFPTELEIKEDD